MKHSATTVLYLAMVLDRGTIDDLARALGWPSLEVMEERGGHHVRWADPHRNHSWADGLDDNWCEAEARSLAERGAGDGDGGGNWRVTQLGKLVVRTRLQAARNAARLTETEQQQD